MTNTWSFGLLTKEDEEGEKCYFIVKSIQIQILITIKGQRTCAQVY